MNAIPTPAKAHKGHGASCCGGSDAAAYEQTAPAVTPADKATDAPEPQFTTKPARSSGCCCG